MRSTVGAAQKKEKTDRGHLKPGIFFTNAFKRHWEMTELAQSRNDVIDPELCQGTSFAH
jgi:hypothetical protein